MSDRLSSISGERSVLPKRSWESSAPACGSEDETRNFQVPEELIELARRNLGERKPESAPTPFAAKPTLVIPVVVPPAAIPESKRASSPLPIVPLEAGVEPPVSDLKAKVAPVSERLARDPSRSPRESSRRPPPLVPSSRSPALVPSRRPPPFEPLRQPVPSANHETDPDSSAPSPLRAYAPFLTAAVIIGAYVALCYFANALIAALP